MDCSVRLSNVRLPWAQVCSALDQAHQGSQVINHRLKANRPPASDAFAGDSLPCIGKMWGNIRYSKLRFSRFHRRVLNTLRDSWVRFGASWRMRTKDGTTEAHSLSLTSVAARVGRAFELRSRGRRGLGPRIAGGGVALVTKQALGLRRRGGEASALLAQGRPSSPPPAARRRGRSGPTSCRRRR